jgi:MOSC domain-containing protein YiiM
MAASLEAICVSERKGIVKTATPRARLRRDHGIDGDAHAGPGHRQVSILGLGEVESFKRRSGLQLRAGAFGENLIIASDELGSLGLGSSIRVGDTAVLSITQLGKQCHHHCAIFHQTGDCIMPRVGLFARVVEGGDIEVGAKAEVLTMVERSRFQAVVQKGTERTMSRNDLYNQTPVTEA